MEKPAETREFLLMRLISPAIPLRFVKSKVAFFLSDSFFGLPFAFSYSEASSKDPAYLLYKTREFDMRRFPTSP